MNTLIWRRRRWMSAAVTAATLGSASPLAAQTAAAAAAESRVYAPAIGRVSFHVNAATHHGSAGERWSDTELWTGIDLHAREATGPGPEFGLDVRYSLYPGTGHQRRFSAYEGYVGLRLGRRGQFRVRGGHLWMPELGSTGALAGGLVDHQFHGDEKGYRLRAGAFAGLEPEHYDAGYARGVRKLGGYLAVERGFLQRHHLGYAMVRQGATRERSVLTSTNYLPIGKSIFVYQAAEVDVQGPADGIAAPGLSYFLANGRITVSRRVELQANYHRGRALDARTLTDNVRSGRLVPAQSIDGWRYESAGGRATVEVVPGFRAYAGYARDRNNQDDAAIDRVVAGGHAGNVVGSGFDLSASFSRLDQASGARQSSFVSLGRSLGRNWYMSVDYATSLAAVRLTDSRGIVVESRPATHRLSGTATATIVRDVSFLCTVDYTRDTGASEVRLLTGASFRLR
jgi:hypothetical protein